jgi:hypothetical protein
MDRSSRLQGFHWTWLAGLASLAATILIVSACGTSATPAISAATGSGLPIDKSTPSTSGGLTLYALTSPVPPPYPVNASPGAHPAILPSGGGLTPDAIKVLTIAALQVSLADYRTSTGAYPPTLVALYPGSEPLGAGGQPIPQSGLADYSYSMTGSSGYTLSASISDGTTYTVRSPVGP